MKAETNGMEQIADARDMLCLDLVFTLIYVFQKALESLILPLSIDTLYIK